MRVSADVLLNYIRCRRFASLNDPENPSYLDSQSRELSSYRETLRQSFIELYLADYQDIDINQRRDYDFHPEITLHENYDFVINDGDTEVVFCLIPVTSSDFLKLRYKNNQHNYQLFRKNNFGAYQINGPEKYSDDSNFADRIRKLSTRSDDEGRLVYHYVFKRYLRELVSPETPTRLYFVLLNSDYIYDGFKYQKNLFTLFDFSFLYEKLKEQVEADVYRMINHLELNDFTPCPLVKKECRKSMSHECKFTGFCFSHIPKTNSILDYFNSHLGFDEPLDSAYIHHDTYELLNEGYVDMLSVPIAWLKNELHLMQRYCTETDFIHVHIPKIEALLKTLKYPLVYLDFEALPCVLPRYRGEKPYSQSVFQYSIHVEKVEGSLSLNSRHHYEFIAKPEYDNRKELVESLIAICNQYSGSVVVYHKTFEEQRLKEMQEIFPEHRTELQNIIDRLFDLRDVVKNNKKFYRKAGFSEYESSRYNFYSAKLSGSYSLKKVIKVFNPEAYENLNIKNGVEAYSAFMRLVELESTERDNFTKDLLEYCKQDTYSMFEIIAGLKQYLSPGFTIQ